MDYFSLSSTTETNNTGKQLRGVSKRQALAGLGFVLSAIPFATPASSKEQRRLHERGKATRHAQNKRITQRIMDYWRRDGDMLVENWVFIDMIDLLGQFGIELLPNHPRKSI